MVYYRAAKHEHSRLGTARARDDEVAAEEGDVSQQHVTERFWAAVCDEDEQALAYFSRQRSYLNLKGY